MYRLHIAKHVKGKELPITCTYLYTCSYMHVYSRVFQLYNSHSPFDSPCNVEGVLIHVQGTIGMQTQQARAHQFLHMLSGSAYPLLPLLTTFADLPCICTAMVPLMLLFTT